VVNALRRVGWPEFAIPIMKAISHAEAGCNPEATYETFREKSVGALQLNIRAHGKWITEWCARDLICSARAALVIYNSRQGLSAWTSYQNGSYLDFLE
jgi:hypothetical protein